MDGSPHRAMEILQARIQEWVAMCSSRGSSQPMDYTQVSHLQVDSLPSEPPGKLSELFTLRIKEDECHITKTSMILKEITERVFETWAKFIQHILVAVPLLNSIAVFRIYASLSVTTGFIFWIKCLCSCDLKYVRGNETSLGKADNYRRVNESIQA